MSEQGKFGVRLMRGVTMALGAALLCASLLADGQGRPGLGKSVTPKTLEGQTATQLSDGRWLLVGGDKAGVASGAVVVNTASGTAQSSSLQQLVYPRYGHTATVLPDGLVAVMGGTGADGKIVAPVEIIDPSSGEVRVVADAGLSPRTNQTATLLTDGEVLITGGSGPNGKPLSSAELWDAQSQARAVNGSLSTARSGQQATLLADGEVLISGGRDAEGKLVTAAEVYDPQSRTFSVATSTQSSTAAVAAVLPGADSTDVPVDSRVAIRLGAPLQQGVDPSQAVTMVGPSGAVVGKVVAAEGGRLLFFTPSVDLSPQATYTVFVRGARDNQGRPIPFTASSFTTISLNQSPNASSTASAGGSQRARSSASAGATPAVTTAVTQSAQSDAKSAKDEKAEKPADEDTSGEDWIPQEKNRHGTWRVLGLKGDPVLNRAAARLAPLAAAAGQTAVTGQVLRYHGKPLAGVAIQINGKSTVTDGNGRFLVSDLAPGVTQLVVDGTAVAMSGRHYTKHFVRVEVVKGKTTSIADPIYLPRVDPATEVSISSPAAKELVLTHPAIPGLEVHIPKGAVLREYDGKIVTKLSITPVPLDRPPYPTPTTFSVYFTLQPGGAYLDGKADQAIRVIYPNYLGMPAGSRANFWNYDPQAGWQIYGQGTVSKDGKQVVPDADVGFRQIISFGMAVGNAGQPPDSGKPVGQNCSGGDPVDCATGLFLHTVTDLAVQDVIPMSVTRTYRQNDNTSRAFGIGTNLSYSMWLYTNSSSSVPPEVDLVLSDGSRVPYLLQSGTSLGNAVWTHTGSPSAFYGSVLKPLNDSTGEGFTITMRDRTVFRFAPHSPNGIVSITDRYGNALTFTVTNTSVGGTITRVASPSGRYIQFGYDAAGRITQATDNIGRTALYSYDSAGRLTDATDALGKKEHYTYDSSNRMTSVTDKRGHVMVTNVYDSNGRVSQQTLADGALWKFDYQVDGTRRVNQTSITDPRGFVRQDSYNSSGYLTKEILAFGQPEQQTTTIQRDGANVMLSRTDNLGRLTQYSYDGYGNINTVTELAGTANAVSRSYTHDPTYQQMTSYSDALGHKSSLSYDWLGNLTSTSDALGDTTRMTYDAQGKLLSITNGLNKVTQFTYDQGDLASVTDPLGRTLSIFTDAAGRTVGLTDPVGNRARYDYDDMSRVLRVTDAKGGITTYTYDANGNVLSVQDPRSAGSHVYTYDNRDRVKTYTDPNGLLETYNYDGMGNLVSRVDRKNQTTTYTYDALNRVKTVTYADNSLVTLTWDGGNRPTQVADSTNGTLTRQYDGLDRVTEESGPRGQVDYQYDSAGRRTQLTVAGISPVTYQYDDANRLRQIAQGSNIVGLTYDASGRRTSVALPNGITATYSYNDTDQMTGVSYDVASTHVGDIAYAYDASGRRIGQSGSLAQLLMPSSVASATYDAANRLTNWGGTPLSYDNNGNLTTLGSSSFTWNSRNQLVASSDGGGGFSYDSLGRRASRTVSGTTTSYLNDGGNPVTAAGNLLLEGASVDELYAQVASSGTTSYLSDGIGSTVALTDGTGAITANYSYAPYGTTSKSGTADTSFQFTGRENDSDTHLYYYRARYYSPQIGRFISEDPSGLGGGNNLYAYANGNPALLIDPMGLASCWLFDCPSLPQGVVNSAAGFGDGVSSILSLGLYSTADFRASHGIDGGVDPCSASYLGGKYAGYAWGVGTLWAAGLNGGANSVFWSGYSRGARGVAEALGTTMEQTPIGRVLDFASNGLGINLPGFVWDAASATFAANASGTSIAVVLAESAASTWARIELPILTARGVAVTMIP